MSAKNDTAFLRIFLMVFGALIFFTFFIMVVANIATSDVSQKRQQDSHLQTVIAERIKPVGEVKVIKAGEVYVEETSEPVAQNSAAVEPMQGKTVYDSACMACHLTGAAGAPKVGDTTLWANRLAQGIETLYANAINGKGAMPPKGGRMDLADRDIEAAVDYMIEQSQ